jgi:hypothetical protein
MTPLLRVAHVINLTSLLESYVDIFVDNVKVAGPFRWGVGLMDLELDHAGWHNVRLVERGGAEGGTEWEGSIFDDLSFNILVL